MNSDDAFDKKSLEYKAFERVIQTLSRSLADVQEVFGEDAKLYCLPLLIRYAVGMIAEATYKQAATMPLGVVVRFKAAMLRMVGEMVLSGLRLGQQYDADLEVKDAYEITISVPNPDTHAQCERQSS